MKSTYKLQRLSSRPLYGSTLQRTDKEHPLIVYPRKPDSSLSLLPSSLCAFRLRFLTPDRQRFESSQRTKTTA